MNALRKLLDKQKPLFEKGGKFEKFYYLFEAQETFLFVPNETTKGTGTHIRDAIDLKRLMMTVVIALIPCLLFGIWNTGHQHYLFTGQEATFLEKIGIGAFAVLPIVLVSYAAGGLVEVVFGLIRKHPINEGFLVTGMLIPLIMPATIPLWQVALATVFAVIIGKEVFGGTGMNILNVALTARAFLYFAYPSQISGDVWTFLGEEPIAEGYTGATALALAAESTVTQTAQPLIETFNTANNGMFTLSNLFWGFVPGSIGETSAFMVLIGALILIATGVGSWKIMLSCVVGTLFMGEIFNLAGANPFMSMPSYYHLVIGGFAFGTVFMATDPVSAAHTERGKWIYGFLIGVLTVLIRVFNPAYPEGIMLAILMMNVFAPLIDFYVVQANKKRRLKRATAV